MDSFTSEVRSKSLSFSTLINNITYKNNDFFRVATLCRYSYIYKCITNILKKCAPSVNDDRRICKSPHDIVVGKQYYQYTPIINRNKQEKKSQTETGSLAPGKI